MYAFPSNLTCSLQEILLDHMLPYTPDFQYSYVSTFFPLHDKEVNSKMMTLFKNKVLKSWDLNSKVRQEFLDEVSVFHDGNM